MTCVQNREKLAQSNTHQKTAIVTKN